jgi:hypothetical protein
MPFLSSIPSGIIAYRKTTCVAVLAQDILDQAVTAHHAEAHGGTVVVVPLPTLGKNDGVQSVVRTVQIQSRCLPLQTLPCWVLRCL